jgi:hypothetical protein
LGACVKEAKFWVVYAISGRLLFAMNMGTPIILAYSQVSLKRSPCRLAVAGEVLPNAFHHSGSFNYFHIKLCWNRIYVSLTLIPKNAVTDSPNVNGIAFLISFTTYEFLAFWDKNKQSSTSSTILF